MRTKAKLRTRTKNPKNYAFIDSQNLNLAIRDLGWKLDFQKFRVWLKDRFRVEKAFIFIGYIEKNQDLYKSLEKYGYKLIFKPTLKYRKNKESFTKGNIDAELVLHSMIEWANYDRAIIVSGDGDFYCLIQHWQKNKKALQNYCFKPQKIFCAT
ncbi:MAG: NYN domain-containing protein [Candidatus Berkelbacteria bacterium]|nr:NYN domain-containing protein [Candidatus Berkelbacteria bacterium]